MVHHTNLGKRFGTSPIKTESTNKNFSFAWLEFFKERKEALDLFISEHARGVLCLNIVLFWLFTMPIIGGG